MFDRSIPRPSLLVTNQASLQSAKRLSKTIKGTNDIAEGLGLLVNQQSSNSLTSATVSRATTASQNKQKRRNVLAKKTPSITTPKAAEQDQYI